MLACPCGEPYRGLCPRCGDSFTYRSGILHLDSLATLSDESSELRAQEQQTRDRQAGIYDWWMRANVPSWIELAILRRAIRSQRPGIAFEFGCGTGRVTLELARAGYRVVAADRSASSLKIAQEKLAGNGVASQVLLVQTDVSKIPIRPGVADCAISAQVIEHLPTGALREAAVAALGRSLREGGRLALSAYEWHPLRVVHRVKEGFHSGGIFFYRFDRCEFAELIGRHVRLSAVRSCLGQILVGQGVQEGRISL